MSERQPHPGIASVPADYTASRRTFLRLAAALEAEVESLALADYQHPVEAANTNADQEGLTPSGATSFTQAPDGEPLYVDVLHLGPVDAAERILVSCGLHGAEAFFGAPVLHTWLADVAAGDRPGPREVRITLVHPLNPHGFAWCTRVNEDNVDPNRNFLLPGQAFAGCPDTYRKLDSLLNPSAMPGRLEPFKLKMLAVLLRHGMAALKQAVAGGQYEFPHGLFYGGQGPVATQGLLADWLPVWTAGAERVLHIDYHTGLGRRGACAILCDEVWSGADLDFLAQIFGRQNISLPESKDLEYAAQGSIGAWCHHTAGIRYLTAGPEYGTYPPLTMLAGLREDNAARRHLAYDHPRRVQARERLRELFCPASPAWRHWAIRHGADLIHKALAVCEGAAK